MTTEQITQTVDSIKLYMAQCKVAMQLVLQREDVEFCEQLSAEGQIDYNDQYEIWQRLSRHLQRMEQAAIDANEYIFINLA